MIDNSQKNGFTLVETLVAIAVLLLAVAAPLSLATKSLNSSALSKQQITASFLAQEAMEYIRNIRDENVIKYSNWLHSDSGVTDCFSPNKCIVDPTITSGPDKIKKCQGNCPLLRYRESNGVYSYDTNAGTADSIYTRVTEIVNVITDREVAVLVTVSWLGPSGVAYKVIARENLTNWQYW
ncbi:MAG: hypothetical protein A3D52_02395 [Candidatus Taylorbacteria bacterium RIFCSPHIGHO2_02_FULL_44_36]|nr:MAG: hypothetical protein A3D52_02395 [Candidatus Taylorbacteria bacterium RIFCSPHIGHO2_02_FULL_44_36]OHA37799.1 MAG: hypothetical protein A3I97_02680 [Candidatus Taylorbacteria bacterium RIFCSPLOWO2_02_FULL_44_35]